MKDVHAYILRVRTHDNALQWWIWSFERIDNDLPAMVKSTKTKKAGLAAMETKLGEKITHTTRYRGIASPAEAAMTIASTLKMK